MDFRSSGKINNSCENGEYSQAGELAETVVVSKNETGQHLPAQWGDGGEKQTNNFTQKTPINQDWWELYMLLCV